MNNLREILQDNIFTKLVRPASFVSLLIIFIIFSIIDGNFFDINIKEIYIKLFGEILQTMVIFYFTSRGLEKVSRYLDPNRSNTPSNVSNNQAVSEITQNDSFLNRYDQDPI